LLKEVGGIVRDIVRSSDVVCRIGGGGVGVSMASWGAPPPPPRGRGPPPGCAEGGGVPPRARSGSLGGARPARAARQTTPRARELATCAEAGMMTAKARGKNQFVLFDEAETERPGASSTSTRDVRSLAHMKMLQSLAGRLNRLNDVHRIGEAIAEELRLLIDYHNCRVVLREGDDLRPVAFLGEHGETTAEAYAVKVGEGVTGIAVERAESLLIPNALECEFAKPIPGTPELEESLAVVPLRHGGSVTGAIVISKLGTNQFDEDDVRLL